MTGHCIICKRPLNNPADPLLSDDCGGDCQACMYKFENDLPWNIEDSRLRELAPELDAEMERRWSGGR